jgi:hypothetical protein
MQKVMVINLQLASFSTPADELGHLFQFFASYFFLQLQMFLFSQKSKNPCS